MALPLCLMLTLSASPLILVAGMASHIVYFIYGERNKEAGKYVVCFMMACVAFGMVFRLLCKSILVAVYAPIIVAAAYLSGIGLSISTYRIFLHRIRKYPGCTSDALTKWSAARVAYRTERYHAHLQALHKEYQTVGNIVRTGPQEISINDVEAIKPIYGRDSPCSKGPWYDLGGTGENLHRTRSYDLHARQRPLWDQAFKEMAHHTDKVELKTAHFIKRLETKKGNVNIAHEFAIFTFIVMGFVIFSIDLDADDASRARAEKSYAVLSRSQSVLATFGHVPWMYSINERLPWLIWQNDEFTALAKSLLDSRRNIKPDKPDLFSYLLPTESDPFTAKFPLEWEARLAMVAGSGNVSSALTSTTFYLAKYPQQLALLREEIDPLLDSDEFDPQNAYVILDSVIYESVRLQPLVPNGGERKTPPEGLKIGEEMIPGDTILRVPSYTLFRDERYFERADEWRPERWTTSKEMVKDQAAFIPFSTGPYRCVGRPLGLVEIRLVLAHLVHTFDIALAQNPDEFENSGKDHFGMVFEKLELIIERRSCHG